MKSLFLFGVVIASVMEASALHPRLDGKIVGGEEVTIEEFPYQVSLQYFSQHMCGASIIDKKFIITAAHCTDGAMSQYLSIRLGSSYHAYGGRVIRVKKIHQHPSYNPNTIDNDISILELEEQIFFYNAALPIQLPYEGQVFAEGSESVVSGWGYLKEGGSGPRKLQAVFVPIVSRQRCQKAYSEAPITDRMICAGIVDEGRKDACQGDSGGPLVYQGKLIGIVSWGYGCARPRYPGVYTNVAALKSFIRSIVQH